MASRRDLAEELLTLAHDDEAAARALLDVGVVTDRIVGFPRAAGCGEGAESRPRRARRRVPFTHDLGALAELSANAGAALPSELSEIDQLTPFGVSLRYGALDDLVPVARATALAWAEQTIAWAGSVLDTVE